MLNENGYYRPSYNEIVADKEQRAKDLFGEDIDTSDLTPMGKFIRIDAYELAKAYEDMELIYYSRYPSYAMGVSLDRLCAFAGITRNPASYAKHIVKVYSEVTAETEVEIGIGELIVCGEDSEITFYNSNNYVIPPKGGFTEVVVECITAGEVGNVEILNEIVNPVSEIERIDYVGYDEAAEEAESDYDLRKRFLIAIEGAGSSNVNAIRAALLRVPTVTSASIIENQNDTADGSGRPPHSFECYVYGGEDYEQEIAEAIFDKAPIGIKTCSTSDTPIIKTVVDEGGYPHTVTFSFTEKVKIKIVVSYKKDSRFEDDGKEQIRKILTDYINGLGAGVDVIQSMLYGKIYAVNGVTEITQLSIGSGNETPAGGNIAIEQWQVAQVESIELNEVV